MRWAKSVDAPRSRAPRRTYRSCSMAIMRGTSLVWRLVNGETPQCGASCFGKSGLFVCKLGWIADRLERLEFDAVKCAINFLDPANVDVLNHVAGLWIDRHRAAWAFPRHSLHGFHERRTIRFAFGFLE